MANGDQHYRIGLLSSLTGTMSFCEAPLAQAAILAIRHGLVTAEDLE